MLFNERSSYFLGNILRTTNTSGQQRREKNGNKVQDRRRDQDHYQCVEESHFLRSHRPTQQRKTVSRERGPNGPATENDKSQLDNLNREFERDIAQLEVSIRCMQFREKSVATEWSAKLRNAEQTLSELNARNIILRYLLKCINDNVFNREPFNKPPTHHNLDYIKTSLRLTKETPCVASIDKEQNKYLNELFNDTYDSGDFLSQLPVPRDGAFFVVHLRPDI